MLGPFDFGDHADGAAHETPGAGTIDLFDAVGVLFGCRWDDGADSLRSFRPSILSTHTATVTTRPTAPPLFGLIFVFFFPLLG